MARPFTDLSSFVWDKAPSQADSGLDNADLPSELPAGGEPQQATPNADLQSLLPEQANVPQWLLDI